MPLEFMVEYTALPMFLPILILALLTSGVLFKSCFGPNTTVLLAKETEVYLTIFEWGFLLSFSNRLLRSYTIR